MNNYITFSELKRFNTNKKNSGITASMENLSYFTENMTLKYSNVFLSHSSDDEQYLPYVINFLETYGGSVYIDKKDNSLPTITNHDTAIKLKQRIQTINKFVLFATENSKNSKWIPWELGLADGIKDYSKIAIFPSVENSNEEKWADREYLGIYQKIARGSIQNGRGEDWIVLNTHENTVIYLDNWLKKL